MQKVFVYFHLKKDTEEVFYVGIGVKFRPHRTSGRSKLWNRIVAKYGFTVKIVHTLYDWEEAKSLEKKYIKEFGRIDNRSGVLANHTDGGDGTLGGHWNIGRKASEETKRKQSEKLKGIKPADKCYEAKRNSGKQKSWNKGVPMTDLAKMKLSESQKGKVPTEEHRRKVSEKLKGRVFSEETRRKNSEGVKRYWKLKKESSWLP